MIPGFVQWVLPRSILMPVTGAAVAIGCAMAGIALAGGRRARILAPVSGGLLAGVALFGLIPEIASENGWLTTLALAAAGYGALALLDFLGHPVCPGCSHEGEFANSLIPAVAIHAFIDGWGMVAAGNRGTVSAVMVGAMMLHKIPEGLALGAMLGMSFPDSPARSATGLAVLAEAPTILGGVAGLWATRADWVNYPLALVAGSFLFLGLHAILPQRRIKAPTVEGN